MRGRILLAGALVVVLVTAGWWILLAAPINQRLGDVEARLADARASEDRLRSQLARLRDIDDREVSYRFAIGEMDAAIPETPRIDALIEEVNVLALRTGVTVQSLGLDPPVEGTQPLRIRMSIALEGRYFEVLGFLYGLEALDRLVVVDAISIVPSSPEDDAEEAGPPEGETTTTTLGPRVRPEVTVLQVRVDATVFTRTPVVATTTTTTTVPDGEAPPEGGDE